MAREMNIDDLRLLINKNLENKTEELRRVFHGRGNFYDTYNFLTVDSIDKILFCTFFEKNEKEQNIINTLNEIAKKYDFESFVVQRRYLKKDLNEVIFGELKQNLYANARGDMISVNLQIIGDPEYILGYNDNDFSDDVCFGSRG